MLRTRGRWIGALLIGALSLVAASRVTVPTHAAPPAQQTRQLVVGTTAEGQFDPAIPETPWVFNGKAGDRVLIDMRTGPASQLDPSLTLLAPDGSTLLTDDDGGLGVNARLGPYTLPEDGTYSVMTSTYSGSGTYKLDLRNLNEMPAITVGTPVTGSVNADHPLDYFQLTGNPDEELLHLVAQGDVDFLPPVIDLYGPEGLIASSEYLNAPDLDPILTEAGTNYVVIVNWDGLSCGGAYELVAQPSDIQLIVPGTAETGELNAETTVGVHYFQGEAGQRAHLSLSSDDLRVTLYVATADYTTYLFSSTGEYTRAISVDLDLAEKALYIIEIREGTYSDTPASGSYTLTLDMISE